MKTKTNPTCAACAMAYNGLNGRMCILMHRNVEYSRKPICGELKGNNN